MMQQAPCATAPITVAPVTAAPVDQPRPVSVERLERINKALMDRVERLFNQESGSFALFQTAVSLESEVRARTAELNETLMRMEDMNRELKTARDTLDAANRMKTRFFTAVGHDVLQPLHAARLTLSTLSELEGHEQGRRLVEQADHALSSIEEMLKTVLDISRLEVGAMQPKLGPVRLEEVLAGLRADFHPLARHKGLDLQVLATSAVVRTDALMLRRIVQNLIGNAVRYTARGRVRVLTRSLGEQVRIEVWDSGPGISHQERRAIFEEFHRGSGAEALGPQGLGLGLSIVQRMSSVLGHPVGLYSRTNCGTCFHLTLPLTADEPAQPRPAAFINPVYGLPAADILVVDNEMGSLQALEGLLMQWNCRPSPVHDVEGARRLCGSMARVPDLVIADYHLDRGERGTDVVEIVRSRFGSAVPAIILTADRSRDTAAAVKSRQCELMLKPVRPAELRALVSHLLS
jgi:signal transduction histidine kinase